MSEHVSLSTALEAHMKALESDDGMIRKRGREALVAMGAAAVTPLTSALGNSKAKQVRWEAAKALGAMDQTRAIPALVKALEDSDSDVIWLAAEALHGFGQAAWPALLTAIVTEGTDSAILRKGAHHVFANQKQSGFEGLLATLLQALEAGALPEAAPIAALEFQKTLSARS